MPTNVRVDFVDGTLNLGMRTLLYKNPPDTIETLTSCLNTARNGPDRANLGISRFSIS